ncbi:hypothetical protein E2C01_006039 [Portunus trituberculatus]|uniref:Uncharacterized protein n=1 Tax=Portunus trituberculatus TaxID=210409 RepID=A0A5B7CV77_PORTR|nr:hypothetical protein [Portunus trituberculatus]
MTDRVKCLACDRVVAVHHQAKDCDSWGGWQHQGCGHTDSQPTNLTDTVNQQAIKTDSQPTFGLFPSLPPKTTSITAAPPPPPTHWHEGNHQCTNNMPAPRDTGGGNLNRPHNNYRQDINILKETMVGAYTSLWREVLSKTSSTAATHAMAGPAHFTSGHAEIVKCITVLPLSTEQPAITFSDGDGAQVLLRCVSQRLPRLCLTVVLRHVRCYVTPRLHQHKVVSQHRPGVGWRHQQADGEVLLLALPVHHLCLPVPEGGERQRIVLTYPTNRLYYNKSPSPRP